MYAAVSRAKLPMLKFVNVPVELVLLPAVSALRSAFVDCASAGAT